MSFSRRCWCFSVQLGSQSVRTLVALTTGISQPLMVGERDQGKSKAPNVVDGNQRKLRRWIHQQLIITAIHPFKINAMAFNETLANRVREMIVLTHKNIEEKRMFGGLCFMVNGKMCVGVEAERMMVRFDPVLMEGVFEKEGVSPMDFTKKIMKGYAFVDIAVLDSKQQLAYWIDIALKYNTVAKAAKKKKKA